jgi:uncharacterized repeat protein (TIGR04076 family)
MAKRYKVRIKVVSQKGYCGAGHKVGDEWLVEKNTPEGICVFAMAALSPFMTPLIYGGAFTWEEDPDVTTVACPDAQNPVVFEIRRLTE